MSFDWLIVGTRFVHATSLLTVAGAVSYMLVRDRHLLPRTVRRVQLMVVLYLVWLMVVVGVGPFLTVPVLSGLRIIGAVISAGFAISVVWHVRRMRVILRQELD